MSKETVLALLEGNEFLSGQEISRRLGLSRTAIWKMVESLRRDGYGIEAKTGLGYRLNSCPDTLSEMEIRRHLGNTQLIGHHLRCFEELDSTNTRAKQLAMDNAPDGTVVVANHQTAGRGRRERTFQSPRSQGIYLSALLRPSLPAQNLLPITAMVGVAVCQAVERVCGVSPGLKWPNDPVLDGKKLCGILTEMSIEGESGHLQYLVLGVGTNVLQKPEDFSSDVADIATSLYQVLNKPVSRPRLAAAQIEALDYQYTSLRQGNLSDCLTEYRKRCVNLGKPVQLLHPDGSREEAEALDVDSSFGLVVRMPGGEQRVVHSGEVSVRGMYGYAN